MKTMVDAQSSGTPLKRELSRRHWKGLFSFSLVVVVTTIQLNSQVSTISSLTTEFSPTRDFDVMAAATIEPFTCPFRDYQQDPNRIYGITQEDYPPAFLRASFYIYGKPPILLPSSKPQSGGKICSRLRETGEDLIMDGTNPSLLSLERIQKAVSSDKFPVQQLLAYGPSASYLVSTTFKRNNQCQYHSENKRGQKTHFQAMKGREMKDADLLIVDSNIRTLWQTHIWETAASPTNGMTNATHYSADDVRLFVHDGDIWMSYKRYENFGKAQRINRIRLEFHPTDTTAPFVAYSDSRKEIEICCGRNFGALPHKEHLDTGTLSFLTWPDPVWLQSLNTQELLLSNGRMRTIDFEDPTHIRSRMPNRKSSNFHGTSNHLLYIPESDEYLCLGHLHRERRWHKDPRKDAAYGHHYTHAFFTISAAAPYRLARLSQEFIFASNVPNFTSDADIVQFASGLEWVPSSANRQIAIGYGINDCEGAIVTVDWEIVESMLAPVGEGVNVAQTMQNMSRPDFLAAVRAQPQHG